MPDLPDTAMIDGNAVRWGRISQGPSLVALHGTPFSSQVWRRIALLFTAHRTAYFFDLIGYGQSKMREDQGISLAVQNRALVALCAKWGVERPDILAHDFGGATALRPPLSRRTPLCIVDDLRRGVAGALGLASRPACAPS